MKFLKLRKSPKVSFPNGSKNDSVSTHAPRGVAAVEFAIVAPILLLILFLMIESSRFLTAIHATTGAAREAARLAAVTGADHTTALAGARQFMADSGFKTTSVSLEIDPDTTLVPGLISYTATVTIPFSDVSVVGDPFNLNVTEVRGSSTMLIPE